MKTTLNGACAATLTPLQKGDACIWEANSDKIYFVRDGVQINERQFDIRAIDSIQLEQIVKLVAFAAGLTARLEREHRSIFEYRFV